MMKYLLRYEDEGSARYWGHDTLRNLLSKGGDLLRTVKRLNWYTFTLGKKGVRRGLKHLPSWVKSLNLFQLTVHHGFIKQQPSIILATKVYQLTDTACRKMLTIRGGIVSNLLRWSLTLPREFFRELMHSTMQGDLNCYPTIARACNANNKRLAAFESMMNYLLTHNANNKRLAMYDSLLTLSTMLLGKSRSATL